MIKYIILYSVIIIGLLTIIATNIYNKIQYLLIKINKADANIKEATHKKYNVLLKLINFLNDNITIDEDKFYELLNVNLNKIATIKLDSIMLESNSNIQEYLNENNKIVKNETFIKIKREIDELDVVINSCRKYYNNNATTYNKLINCFPTKLVAKIGKFKTKDFYAELPKNKLKILENE